MNNETTLPVYDSLEALLAGELVRRFDLAALAALDAEEIHSSFVEDFGWYHDRLTEANFDEMVADLVLEAYNNN